MIKVLLKTFDWTKTYLKVTNKEECHHNLQYREGLIVDPIPFNSNPKECCCKGGIYFTTPEYIHRFFWIGSWIRKITVPEDAKVVMDIFKDKFRADKVILGERYNFGWYFDNYYDKKVFLEEDYLYLIEFCSKYFNKWFNKKTFPKKDCWQLAKYCPEHFKKWFNVKSFPEKDWWYLAKYCSNYKQIWNK